MSRVKIWLGLLGWLVSSLGAGAFGSQFMPGAWYESLVKPAWTPPNWVFGPVWTLLYILMAVAAWLVWKRYRFKEARLGLSLFVAQLVLNAAWSYLFFGIQRIDLALGDILALWTLILIVTILFWNRERLSGVMMLPYLAWVSFAVCLNFALWQLN